jgi:hypothetical protein
MCRVWAAGWGGAEKGKPRREIQTLIQIDFLKNAFRQQCGRSTAVFVWFSPDPSRLHPDHFLFPIALFHSLSPKSCRRPSNGHHRRGTAHRGLKLALLEKTRAPR